MPFRGSLGGSIILSVRIKDRSHYGGWKRLHLSSNVVRGGMGLVNVGKSERGQRQGALWGTCGGVPCVAVGTDEVEGPD